MYVCVVVIADIRMHVVDSFFHNLTSKQQTVLKATTTNMYNFNKTVTTTRLIFILTIQGVFDNQQQQATKMPSKSNKHLNTAKRNCLTKLISIFSSSANNNYNNKHIVVAL